MSSGLIVSICSASISCSGLIIASILGSASISCSDLINASVLGSGQLAIVT